MSREFQWIYDETGRKGPSLFSTLSEHRLDNILYREIKDRVQRATIGHADFDDSARVDFVDWVMRQHSGQWFSEFYDEIMEGKERPDTVTPDLFDGHVNVVSELDVVCEFLRKNHYPEGMDRKRARHGGNSQSAEENDLWEWAGGYTNSFPPWEDWKTGSQESDVETAWLIGLLTDEKIEKKAAEMGVVLKTKAPEDQKGPEQLNVEWVYDHEAYERVSRELILVRGFYCDIHGDLAEFDKPIPMSAVVKCPSCGHPVCPVCADKCNHRDKKEWTVEDAQKYLDSARDDFGMAMCGQCGDYGVGFAVEFLKMKGAPMPEGFEAPEPEEPQFVATNRVAADPRIQEMLVEVRDQYKTGGTGIYKTKDSKGGEVWGIFERHPQGPVVTLTHSEDR